MVWHGDDIRTAARPKNDACSSMKFWVRQVLVGRELHMDTIAFLELLKIVSDCHAFFER